MTADERIMAVKDRADRLLKSKLEDLTQEDLDAVYHDLICYAENLNRMLTFLRKSGILIL